MGVLPAASARRALTARSAAVAAAVLCVLTAVVPPMETLARRYEFVEAIQFSLLAVAAPALLTLGAPWSRSRRASALAAGRRRRPEVLRSAFFLLVFAGAVVAWRVPASVDALQRDGWWLVLVEAATLVVAGVGLWLELVESPPLSPRAPRALRALWAALPMWTIWVTAYAVGLSRGQVYAAFHHAAGGLSVAADQEVTTATLWAAAFCAFVPVVFASLLSFLQHEEQPEEELRKLVREQARRSSWERRERGR